MQALRVVHDFAAPDVVLDYLMTGKDRSAARSAPSPLSFVFVYCTYLLSELLKIGTPAVKVLKVTYWSFALCIVPFVYFT